MLLEIVKYPNPILARKASEIAQITPELRELAANMAETMYAADGIGLAAPQVGVPLRLITVDTTGPDMRAGLRTYINPVITLVGEDFCETEEGCLSVPDFRSQVERCENIRLTATDLEGNTVEIEADGLLSICLQHECDHLEGKLFLDRISRLKKGLYDSKIKKLFRKAKQSS